MYDPDNRLSLFPAIGTTGVEKITRARVLLLGVGATGSALAESLVRAGVGTLILVDRDLVEKSNLGRQSLYTEADIGLPKAPAARTRLKEIRHDLTVEAHILDARAGVLEDIADGCDLLLDGSDNFAARFLLNVISLRCNIPWIYTAAIGSLAVSMPVLPGESACLRCLFPEQPQEGGSCDTEGVLYPAVSAAAALSGTEALKILSGQKEKLRLEMWTLDVWKGKLGKLATDKLRGDCPACAGEPALDVSDPDTLYASARCSRSCQISPAPGSSPPDFNSILQRFPKASKGPWALEVPVEESHIFLFPDGQAIVENCGERGRAKQLYRRILNA
ncbi:MAG: ThiF family adenylyltransferase [Candidatus Krumholzibacteria bacterium]|jgi:adenylyltransferase/sulfurtransferase|nr:ThiF family adenylyltransferase [Candidatus Krumholzibacteria bacterium]MDP6669508.1 ThiF family adenylyltransferase [Candidatus Krumholzibacteria bacterium]MDP6798154.1 ThiF family adenylyltransferase [Candidatus Krumholzibacteria bacterium]MDP7021999.1 ThiF family adenylyltransferase [Candidatus Krumholzibacteria bacterium]